MRKFLCVLLTLCMLLLSAAAFADPDPVYGTPMFADCNEYITLRSSPGTSASKVIKIPVGETVAEYERSGKWSYVCYNGYSGWVLTEYLSSLGGYWYADCNEYISLRAHPSTSATALTKIPAGDPFVVQGWTGDWAFVCYRGHFGYVLDQYVSWYDTSYYDGTMGTWYVFCNEFISLRSSASTSATRLKQVPNKTALTVYWFDGDWAYVNYNGTDGYVLSAYLEPSLEPGAPVYAETWYVDANEYVHLRKSASTSASSICRVYDGSPVLVYSKGETWAECEYDGHVGYILSAYLVKNHSTRYRVVCNEFVSLRSSASTSSTRLKQVPNGASVNVYSISGKWAYCSYLGTDGYILAEYLKKK